MNSSIFREYDIRGLHPQDLTPDTVRRIAMAFGSVLRERGLKKISVGGDVRLHTDEIKNGFIAGVNATGIHVIDIGIITSPLCYFSAFHLEIDGFAMITASHNPKEYNGLKLGIGKQTIFGDDIVDIRSRAEKGIFAEGKGKCESVDITEEYIRMLESKFKLSKKIKMVLDPANATGALFAREVYRRIGADVIAINDTVDGTSPLAYPNCVA